MMSEIAWNAYSLKITENPTVDLYIGTDELTLSATLTEQEARELATDLLEEVER